MNYVQAIPLTIALNDQATFREYATAGFDYVRNHASSSDCYHILFQLLLRPDWLEDPKAVIAVADSANASILSSSMGKLRKGEYVAAIARFQEPFMYNGQRIPRPAHALLAFDAVAYARMRDRAQAESKLNEFNGILSRNYNAPLRGTFPHDYRWWPVAFILRHEAEAILAQEK